MNRPFLALLFGSLISCFVLLSGLPSRGGQPAANAARSQLELVITDSAMRQPVLARVRVRDGAGRDYVPEDAVEVPIAEDRWFVADGTVKLPVPAGTLSLRVERGPEYEPVSESLKIGSEPVTRHNVALRRWINLRELGYVCGENHLHVSAGELGAMLAAEGLDIGTSLLWWNGPRFKVPTQGEDAHRVSFGQQHFPATLCDAEVEDQWGAVYLIGLKQPLEVQADARRWHLPLARAAHEQGALVCYQAGWSREVLLDALLGYVDVVNVCNNNFQRHKYQPRRQFSNLLMVEGLPDYPETPEGMMLMNMESYYRLLNCGLRLAAGAGSATGAKTTPAGYNRSYVRLPGAANEAAFLEAWRGGRNFVTDGPMIFLTVNGSNSPGSTVALPKSGGPVQARVRAVCNQPLRSLDLVVNGSVVAQATLGAEAREGQAELSVNVQQGSWIAARATAEDRLLSDEEMAPYAKSVGKLQKPCRLLFGHTSPVYVTVGGAGAAVPASLHEAARMLDGFDRFALKMAAEQDRSAILDAVRTARHKLTGQ